MFTFSDGGAGRSSSYNGENGNIFSRRIIEPIYLFISVRKVRGTVSYFREMVGEGSCRLTAGDAGVD